MIFKRLKHVTVVIVLILATLLNAQSEKTVTFIYNNDISLRDISQKYLGDPNLWTSILAYNHFKSINEIKNGTVLTVPSFYIKSSKENIDSARNNIVKATKNGAEIFSKSELDSSIANLHAAKELSENNKWDSAFNRSKVAEEFAEIALQKALQMRNHMSDATISARDGTVEKRKPTSRQWNNAELFSNLFELDRTRTLSNSFAEILFYDLSKFRLNENAQAIIQKSRVDLLKEQSQSSITLIEGDAFTRLVQNPKDNFKIDIPGLTTKVNSKYFWIDKNENSTKVANYDGEISIKAQDSLVVVKKNQGSVIPDGGVPTTPKDLLSSPVPLSPPDAFISYSDSVLFEWDKVPGAESYWLEIVSDPAAQILVDNFKNIETEKLLVRNILQGNYYWRIAAVNEFGLPGSFSNTISFTIEEDKTKPFLTLMNFPNKLTVKHPDFNVKGKTENFVTLRINNKRYITKEDGTFNADITLEPGINILNISVTDNANNITSITKNVIYESDPDVEFSILNLSIIDKKLIYINRVQTPIRGKTRPYSTVELNHIPGNTNYISYADKNGYFHFLINNTIKNDTLSFHIVTPGGYSLKKEYILEFDNTPPELELSNDIPSITKDPDQKLTGYIRDAETLLINSIPVEITDNRFEHYIELKEGANLINFQAKDKAGNFTQVRKTIILDTKAPVLEAYSFTPLKNSKNKEFVLTIKAKDENQLKKTVFIKIQVGQITKSKYVEINTAKNEYYDIFSFTGNAKPPRLVQVVLEDYVGNKNSIQLNN